MCPLGKMWHIGARVGRIRWQICSVGRNDFCGYRMQFRGYKNWREREEMYSCIVDSGKKNLIRLMSVHVAWQSCVQQPR